MNYLYNSVGPLPGLPKLDDDKKDVFKYALIISKNQRAAVTFFDSPVYFKGYEYGSTTFPKVTADTDFATIGTSCDYGDDAWLSTYAENQYSAANGCIFSMPIVWANFDIMNEDGTLYLAASAPVSVSPVQINPALLVQGFLAGQALRRNRNG